MIDTLVLFRVLANTSLGVFLMLFGPYLYIYHFGDKDGLLPWAVLGFCILTGILYFCLAVANFVIGR
jgi:hypothetical protein